MEQQINVVSTSWRALLDSATRARATCAGSGTARARNRSFLALAVMVVRPFSDVPDDEATAALLDKLAGLVSATQGRIIRHQVERTHPLSS